MCCTSGRLGELEIKGKDRSVIHRSGHGRLRERSPSRSFKYRVKWLFSTPNVRLEFCSEGRWITSLVVLSWLLHCRVASFDDKRDSTRTVSLYQSL